MASVQEQALYSFSSTGGGQTYRYDIVVDAQGNVSARNFRSPLGLIADPYTSLPQSVIQDVADAKDLVALRNQETEAVGGNVTFTGQTSQNVAIAPGILNNANYRVAYTTTDGMFLRTTGKTTTGFTVEAASAYGTVATPKTVIYSVLVPSLQSSAYGGTAVITDADAGEKTITFPVALTSANYRVVLTPDGFFPVFVSSKLKTAFTIRVGYTLQAAESITVGYDVFV